VKPAGSKAIHTVRIAASDAETSLELAAAARAAAGDIGIRIERRGGAYAAAGLKVVIATRRLWLPALHADGGGWSDWAGGIGFPVEGVCVPCVTCRCCVCCAAAADTPKARASPNANTAIFLMSPRVRSAV